VRIEVAAIDPGPPTVLSADDYAISPRVSEGIEELADAGRLSGTSAIVTLPDWPVMGRRLKALRPHLALGLHLNLTLGRPLAPMQKFTPAGTFLDIGTIMAAAAVGVLDAEEIFHEIIRQWRSFCDVAGFEPDFVDGHQHVHIVPTVRDALLKALVESGASSDLLIRDPADRMLRVLRRGLYLRKAAGLSSLGYGFAAGVRRAGYITNHGFSGISQFDCRSSYPRELERSFRAPGPRHLVMCHPGHTDDKLRALDPVTDRRETELRTIASANGLVERIWRIRRDGQSLWEGWGTDV
jgi:predicted glycoside hydrolase/deacetylase ChbG (UPF0249 family)